MAINWVVSPCVMTMSVPLISAATPLMLTMALRPYTLCTTKAPVFGARGAVGRHRARLYGERAPFGSPAFGRRPIMDSRIAYQ